MKNRFLVPSVFVFTAGLAVAALAGDKAGDKAAAPAAAPAPAPPPAAWATAAKDQKWQPMDPKNPKGAMVSLISGDFKGPTSILLKLPAGQKAGLHAHSSDYYGVVLAGAPVHGDTEATAKPAAVGSTWFEPSKKMHYDGCPGAVDCIMVVNFTQSGPDYIPPPAAAPAPAKK